MTAPDPFALGGRQDDGDDGIIVDEDGLAALALLENEPKLGPLARRSFEVGELVGNLVPRGDNFRRLWALDFELDQQIIECPADTVGGIAWRLGEINRIVQDEAGVSDWLRSSVQAAYEDALRLAKASKTLPLD